jgi:hypothetical protein
MRIIKTSKQLVLLYETNATTITGTLEANGLLRGISVVVPNLDSTDTITLALLDSDGGTIYSKASIAESATTTAYIDANDYPLQLPLHGTITISIITSGSQTADRTFKVNIYYES